ncbi:MAG: ABC transporter substrate-binding protein [Chloroflexota bacterium]
MLTETGRDRKAAALELLDGVSFRARRGPYRVTTVVPGERMLLTPVPGQSDPPAIGRIVLRAVPDPAVAATMLQAGDVDSRHRPDRWTPSTASPAVAGCARSRRRGSSRFNTRKGRPYADALTRAAFAACIDRDGLTARVGAGAAIVADTPSPRVVGHGTAQGQGRDVGWAERRLDSAGWTMGSDGIRVRDGQRLSSSVALRGSQVQLLTMLQAVAEQLRDCGIELTIEDLDVTGDRSLEAALAQRLRHPADAPPARHGPGHRPPGNEGATRPRRSRSPARTPAGSSRPASTADSRRPARPSTRASGRGSTARSRLTTEAPAWWVRYEHRGGLPSRTGCA